MKIIQVDGEVLSDNNIRLCWVSDDGQFGEITFKYLDDGNYHIDAEFLGLETIAQIMKKWIENGK